MITRVILTLAALALTGCGVAYTSIRQDPDGSYVVTGAHSGFFAMSGTVYKCTAEGDKMRCKQSAEN